MCDLFTGHCGPAKMIHKMSNLEDYYGCMSLSSLATQLVFCCCCLFVYFETTPSCVQGLLMTLCSKVTPRGLRVPWVEPRLALFNVVFCLLYYLSSSNNQCNVLPKDVVETLAPMNVTCFVNELYKIKIRSSVWIWIHIILDFMKKEDKYKACACTYTQVCVPMCRGR